MPIYEKPTRVYMHEWAEQNLTAGQTFDKNEVVRWFAKNYPDIKKGTVTAHVESMAVNTQSRHSYPSIKPNAGYDLFFKVGRGVFRLWDAAHDPAPIYKGQDTSAQSEVEEEEDDAPQGSAFALEDHLQTYLVRNLHQIEHGLTLYEDEGLTGREYPADNRKIDILAVDKNGHFVVIETKVGKAYDRVIGQLLFYKTWVEENLADGAPVRGIIIGTEISPSLRLATKTIPNVALVEYEISFSMKQVNASDAHSPA